MTDESVRQPAVEALSRRAIQAVRRDAILERWNSGEDVAAIARRFDMPSRQLRRTVSVWRSRGIPFVCRCSGPCSCDEHEVAP